MRVTKDTFNEEIKAEVPVIVDFYADWCGPCKMIAPHLEEIEREYEGKVKILKVNVDTDGELAVKFGIISIPTLIVFENGEPTKKVVGYQNKNQLINLINKE
ncbi:MAG: thioredoxin [Clostridia bacterium]|nr:thioredoxin [Clostridia bacterium]